LGPRELGIRNAAFRAPRGPKFLLLGPKKLTGADTSCSWGPYVLLLGPILLHGAHTSCSWGPHCSWDDDDDGDDDDGDGDDDG